MEELNNQLLSEYQELFEKYKQNIKNYLDTDKVFVMRVRKFLNEEELKEKYDYYIKQNNYLSLVVKNQLAEASLLNNILVSYLNQLKADVNKLSAYTKVILKNIEAENHNQK